MKKIFVFAILISSLLSAFSQEVPTSSQVGALKLPDTIAQIVAPFEMPKLVKPEFPDRTINIESVGAQQNKLCTNIIQKAINKLSSKGGGTVVVPAGQWLTGRIILKSNVNLHLDKDAELHFSGDIKDCLPVVFTRNEGIELYSLGAFIYANGATNIALTGQGKLVGPSRDCEILKKQMEGVVIEKYISTPVEKRIFDGKDGKPVFLPMFFAPMNCKNVFVEGVTFEKTLFWNVVPQYCENVIIRGITVNSVGIFRSDGIDIDSSKNILVEYCTLDCGDDCFTLKSGRCEDGLRVNKPSENIIIRYCLAKRGGGSVTCGSETAGMIRNMYVHDCVFDGTKNGILFKTRRNRGGGGENLYYERIRLNIPGPAIKWDMLGSSMHVGELANRLPARSITPLTPSYKNIFMKDIVIENCDKFIRAIGIPETKISNVVIENCNVSSKALVEISDVDGFVVKNTQIKTNNSAMNIAGANNIIWDNVKITTKD